MMRCLAKSVGSAVGPIEWQSVTNHTAEKLINGHIQVTCFEVHQGIFYCRDSLLGDATVCLPGTGIEFGRESFMCHHIFTDDPFEEALDDLSKAWTAVRLVVFGNPGCAILGHQSKK